MARYSRITSVSVGGTSQIVVAGAPNRVALILMGGNAGRVTVSADSPAVLDAGITFVQQSGILEFDIDRYGDVVSRPWFGIAAVGPTIIGVIEVMEG